MFKLKYSAAVLAVLVAGAVQAATAANTQQFHATSAVGGGADHSLWIGRGFGPGNAIGTDFNFKPHGKFTLFGDGTASLTGKTVSQGNPDAGFIIDFQYDDNVSPTARFKEENGSKQQPDVQFRNLTGGTLTGTGILDGLDFTVRRAPEDGEFATQIGTQANNKNKNFGMAHWFFVLEATSINCRVCGDAGFVLPTGGQGDINVDLAPVPVPAALPLAAAAFAGLFALGRRRRAA